MQQSLELSVPVMWAGFILSWLVVAYICATVIPWHRRKYFGRIVDFVQENESYAWYRIEAKDGKGRPVIRTARLYRATTKLGDEVVVAESYDLFGRFLKRDILGVPHKPRWQRQPS